MERTSLTIFVLCAAFGVALACDGFKMKVTSVRSCGGADQVIKIAPNSTAKLSKQCEIVPKTCVETKGFSSAKVNYKIFKNNIPIMQGGPEDLCKEMEGSGGQMKAMLEMLGLPTSCPVEESAVCATGDKKIDIKKHRQFLGMAMGKIKAHADITHDTTDITLAEHSFNEEGTNSI